MKIKNFLLIIVLTVMICISGRQVVKAGSPPSPATSAGAAAIRGVVKFTGAVPVAKPISMSADPSCAKQHPAPFLAKEVVVDSTGGLQNAIVFVADGLGDRTFDPPTEPVVIAQKGCLYQPHVIAVRANQPLEVVNNDSTAHGNGTRLNSRGLKLRRLSLAKKSHSGEVQHSSLDAGIYRSLQAPLLRGDEG